MAIHPAMGCAAAKHDPIDVLAGSLSSALSTSKR
jgi:hypothetical protein